MIKIRSLSFAYGDGRQALQDIDLDIGRGEIFGIIGPTGAGKSTLLHLLNGLLHGRGEIFIDGIKLDRKSEPLIRQKVGLVFQNPEDQLFCPTVFEDVVFGLLNMGITGTEAENRVNEILRELHLTEMARQPSHHLSFGEKKRVAFATTLVMEPAVLALDEPFANLDYASMLSIVKWISRLDITRIVVSQDILHAFAFCQRIAVLHRGRVVMVGQPEEIAQAHDLLREIGLDYRPYVQAIRKLL